MSSSEGVDSAPAASANTAIEAAAPPAAIGYFARKLAHDLNNFATQKMWMHAPMFGRWASRFMK